MDQVITYDKTYQERLTEYMDVLASHSPVTVSQIKKEWSFYVELAIDSIGWQAIWKIPRITCEELQIEFPTIVLVYVENVDCAELKAKVKILAVQDDDIHLPMRHAVPLIQLWPTKEQDSTVVLNLESTANTIDMLRFFYTNIFMPWDLEEDNCVDWLSKHLEPRLRLYYDICHGIIPRSMAEHIKYLLAEARRLQARQEQLAVQLDGKEEMAINDDTENEQLDVVLDIHVRLLQIRSEVEVLEDPLLRSALLRKQKQLNTKESDSPVNWLVYDQGNIDEYMALLNQVRPHIADKNVTFISTLGSALESASPNDSIFLSNSKHSLASLGALQEGGTLKGLYAKADTIITTTNDIVMLDCRGDLTLANLTINASSVQCGFLIRSGTLTLQNCTIVGDGKSSTHQGIIVLAGGALNMMDCDVNKFYTAIVANQGAAITLKNCEICDVNVGIKTYENCSLTIQTSMFHHCKDYGVCVETENILGGDNYRVGGVELLKIIPEMVFENLVGENNGKGDVIINKKCKLQPVRDLFSNAELDPTISSCESNEEEEMEVNVTTESIEGLNNTIVKIPDADTNSVAA